MAFPTVDATNNSSETANTTSHAVSLPSGIQAGDLLVAGFAADGTRTVTWPEGWTELRLVQDLETLSVGYREADGGEGASITVSTSGSEKSAHISYRISGAEDPDTQAPEASTGATGPGTDQSPDPDGLTPTGGAKDYLWLAFCGWGDGRTFSSYPASYTSGINNADCTAWDCEGVAAAQRNLNAASEDPGTFGVSAWAEWCATTVAIHPASAAGVIPNKLIQASQAVSRSATY